MKETTLDKKNDNYKNQSLKYLDKMFLKYAATEWVVYKDVSYINALSRRRHCDVNNTVNYSVQSAVEIMSDLLIIK